MSKADVRVAITGFGGLDNPEAGTAIARAIRSGWKGPIEIDALCYNAWDTGAWVPGLADHIHIIPPVVSGDEVFFNRILDIHRKRPLNVIIPALDLEVPVLSRLSRRLERLGIKTLLPALDDVEAVTKTALPQFCFNNNFKTPKTVYVPNVNEIPFHEGRIGFPLFLKSLIAGAVKVANLEQAISEAPKIQNKWGGGLLLQEPIIGDEYVVAMIARENGACLDMLTVRKLVINSKGKSVVGVVIDDPDLKKSSRKILEKLHWRGPLELEFIRCSTSDELYLIEINCRFPSWIGINRYTSPNLPTLLLQEILTPGHRKKLSNSVGQGYVRDVLEFAVPGEDIRHLLRFGRVEPPKAVKSRLQANGINVGVTGISAFELTQSGLGIGQALRQSEGIKAIYGLAYAAYDTGLQRKDIFDGGFGIPNWSEPEAVIKRIKEIHKKVHLDVLLPCMDFEIGYLTEYEEELKAEGIHMLLPSKSALKHIEKLNLLKNGTKQDWGGFVRIPTLQVGTLKELDHAWGKFGSPMVLKGNQYGSTNVFDKLHAQTVWKAARNTDAPFNIAQPMIFGDEYSMSVVFDRDHNMLDHFVIKKQLMCERGKTWGAIAVEPKELIDSVAQYLRSIKWTGPADVEIIRDVLTDRFHLIEINPRAPAWSSYCAMHGNNTALQCVKAALGQKPLPSIPAKDLVFMRSTDDLPARALDFALFASRKEIIYG